MAALSCGTEAETFGSLMMFASGSSAELAEFGEVVRDSLLFGQEVGKVGEDAAGERDVAGFHRDAGVLGEGLDDGQEGVGGEGGGFVGLGVDDGGCSGHEIGGGR